MLKPFEIYNTVFFDCDGVILNSNNIKSEAFYEIALPFGSSQADQLLDYHISNGGISRYKKIEFFLSQICDINPASTFFANTYKNLLSEFRDITNQKLISCEYTHALPKLREFSKASWHVVSGSDEDDLNSVLDYHKLSPFFDSINGSPRSKVDIVNSLIYKPPVLFIGDSVLDYDVACHFEFNFLFLTSWSDLPLNHPLLSSGYISIAESLNSLASGL